MKLELKDEKGVIGTIEVPLEQLKKALGLGSASAESKALLKENEGNVALLKESQKKVAELEEKLATGGRTMGDFTPTEKADFVIAWAKGLSLEDKAIFAEAVGIPIAKATEAEVAEAEQKAKAEAEGEPLTIPGKTDRPGYKYLEHLNISVREEEKT